MAEPVSLDILAGEQVAIVGPNGSGKSRLADMLMSRYPLMEGEIHYDLGVFAYARVSDNIRRLTFRDSYGDADHTYYLQQRWNQHDIDPETPTVGDLLGRAWASIEKGCAITMTPQEQQSARQRRTELRTKLYALFDIEALADKLIISLSSGELRKFQLTRTLLAAPRILILDNPFVGLDADARKLLRTLLRTLINETDLQVILELSREDEIPDFTTHVIPVAAGLHVMPKMTRADFLKAFNARAAATSTTQAHNAAADTLATTIKALPAKDITTMPFYTQGGDVITCRNVSITYGAHTILRDITWSVREGERWALLGRNGSGKSTLLSLVCADNPQGYAADIRLFGHQRGSGESIWDIKRHIGYVSPELHRAYSHNIPAIDVVASGLHDSVGLYRRARQEERQTCLLWMEIFGIEPLAERAFLTLSSGEQRLCLLARAFVKDPELLILDEPLHGLDTANRQRVGVIIEAFCQRSHKTLVMVTHYPEELPSCITNTLHL